MSVNLISPGVATKGLALKGKRQVGSFAWDVLSATALVVGGLGFMSIPAALGAWALWDERHEPVSPMGWASLALIGVVQILWIAGTLQVAGHPEETRQWASRKFRSVRTVEAWHSERQRVKAQKQARAAARQLEEERVQQARAVEVERLSQDFIRVTEALLEAQGMNTLEATVETSRLLEQAMATHQRLKGLTP